MRRAMLSTLALICICTSALAQEGHLMRYADVHGDRIVFTYEDDLWLVDAAGGDAWRITRHPGREDFARFSPDGSQIAFIGSYDGGDDIYVMDARGGVPRRITFAPSTDVLVDWWPDGQSLLFRARREYPFRAEELYRVSVNGGMPERLPVDRGGLAAISSDGRFLAYNRISRETATWKRYQGGMAQEIWLADLESGDIRALTDWRGTDNYPMWHGNKVVFTSDRKHGTLNLYEVDPGTGIVNALTDYRDYDVKYPSMGNDGRVVYQYGESLHLLDVDSGSAVKLTVNPVSDRVHVRPRQEGISPSTGSFGLSPSGTRALIEARGEILNLPVEDGDAINLTRSPGSREKNAAWSPDGKRIAFVSDRSGEEEIYLVDPRGAGEWKKLDRFGQGFLLPLVWSPDSRKLLYSDKSMQLYMTDVESGRTKILDRAEYDDAWERWGIQDYVWSPDSRWIAYTKMDQNLHESIYLYSVDDREIVRITDGMTTDWSPSFDPQSRYLYFLSNRHFAPTMGFQDQNHVFLDMTLPYVVILRDGERSPFVEEDVGETAEDEDEDAEESSDETPPTQIDIARIDRRVVVAEGVEPGTYFRLEATEDGFLLLSRKQPQFLKYQTVNDHTEDELELLGYSIEEQELSELMSGIANYHRSADGSKLIYRAESSYGVVDSGKEAKPGDGKLDLGEARIEVDRGQEFMQIFNEAWRIQRDWFYDPGMHGVDWVAIGEKYRRFVPNCGVRGDLNYLIGEMIAELNIGHTYISGGEFEDRGARVRTGMLGADFEAVEGADYYRIAHIVPGVSWDPDQRSPLAEPGSPVKEGQYLIAIDGEPVRSDDNVFRHLVDKADRFVTLSVNDRPTPDGAQEWRVRTIGSERSIRYREWVERNRALVRRLGSDRIAYMHLPDMMTNGLIEFARAYYPQAYKRALIIDERYNGGGFVGDMIIDRLERELWGITVPREGGTLRDPERDFHGPIVVIINEDTGSNGEYFAEAIQRKNLATVLGMRTWGGAVGIEPHQDLVDGGATTPPQFGIYGLEGDWIIEGLGVVPDVEVQNMPASVVRGEDTQLESAVRRLLEELEQNGERWAVPKTPPFPDKSKGAGE